METPKNPAGEMTERIMQAIAEHIKPEEREENAQGAVVRYVPHYNRAFEAVYKLLAEVPVARVDFDPRKVCGRLLFRGGSYKACVVMGANHPGPCHPEL